MVVLEYGRDGTVAEGDSVLRGGEAFGDAAIFRVIRVPVS